MATTDKPTKANRKDRPKAKRPQTGKLGAQLQRHTAEAIELVADLLGSWLTRKEIIAGYAQEVEQRRQAREMDEATLSQYGPKEQAAIRRRAQAYPLRPRSESQVDDYIRAAKDRLIAESSPGMKNEIRAKVTKTYSIATKRLLAAGDHEAAARVTEKQAKLFGLVVERQKIETVGGAPNDTRDLTDDQLETILGGD